ncbi:ferritin-like domain-containing protein [Ectothiorhodospiraceae bacterium WFHF3C12]|nr:ferritin-like domain-containing protein [Ectothiorhodospiraceae bacterium WFHF3C12]
MREQPEVRHDVPSQSRRGFLFDGMRLALSGAAIGLLAGSPRLVRANVTSDDQAERDANILATALGAEREAIAAYLLGANSGLLSSDVLSVALSFQGHHKEHADALANAIRQLGGTVPEPPKRFNFPVEQFRNQTDVLEFAAGLERGAVSAYAGAIPLFENRDLSKAAASILADEAMHWAVLRQALGLDPVPGAFFS